ncbi:MAG: hypothetical protein AABX73_04320 [Nanoarchaeota archaeon]
MIKLKRQQLIDAGYQELIKDTGNYFQNNQDGIYILAKEIKPGVYTIHAGRAADGWIFDKENQPEFFREFSNLESLVDFLKNPEKKQNP